MWRQVGRGLASSLCLQLTPQTGAQHQSESVTVPRAEPGGLGVQPAGACAHLAPQLARPVPMHAGAPVLQGKGPQATWLSSRVEGGCWEHPPPSQPGHGGGATPALLGPQGSPPLGGLPRCIWKKRGLRRQSPPQGPGQTVATTPWPGPAALRPHPAGTPLPPRGASSSGDPTPTLRARLRAGQGSPHLS